MAKALKFVVLVGSVREGRMADRVLKLLMNNTKNHKDIQLEVLDAKEANLPILVKPLHHYQDRSKAPEILLKLDKSVKEADGILLISAEYNRAACPGLINMVDHLPPASFAYKPSAIISYSMGPAAGFVGNMSLRPLMAEVGAPAIGQTVGIGTVHQAVTADGTTENEHIISGINKLLTSLAWWARACKDKRDKDGIPS